MRTDKKVEMKKEQDSIPDYPKRVNREAHFYPFPFRSLNF
jgi:hypothetical protein